ncbi:MAG: hypothetical protein P1U85_11715 [Verrucomicrobiales bacterium]|nr:hypothetical protein [Verrucomicrobiales bacterium]
MPLRSLTVSLETWRFLLKLCVSVTLAARGWLTMRWDSPLRSVAWNEDWWAAPLESIAGIPWEKVALHSDEFLSRLFDVIGLFLIGVAILLWVLRGNPIAVLLSIATLVLLLDGLGRWVASGYQFGMAIEHALQIVTPVAWILRSRLEKWPRVWGLLFFIAAAMTFLGHGLYAAGVHPVPLSYQTMTMKLLFMSQETALIFLTVAGWLDILVAGTLFVPRLREISLLYMVAWGGLTALARIASHIGLEQPLFGLDPWLAETFVRTPHWLLPLLALFLLRGLGEKTEPKSVLETRNTAG